MTKKSTIRNLENRYHVSIHHDSLYDTFDIYSYDNCHWACVGGYRSLVSELAESKAALNRIYESYFEV